MIQMSSLQSLREDYPFGVMKVYSLCFLASLLYVRRVVDLYGHPQDYLVEYR